MNTQLLLQILGIIIALALVIYPKIDQYQDKRKKGFWNKLKPQGKKIFILGIILTLIQLALLFLSINKNNNSNSTIRNLNNKIDSLNQIKTIEIKAKSPELNIYKLELLKDSVAIKIENFGERSADSLRFIFCAYKLSSENEIIENICPTSTGFQLPKSAKVTAGNWFKIKVPIGIKNYKKEYKQTPFIFKVELEYKDNLIDSWLSYERIFVWKGLEDSKLNINPAAKLYEEIVSKYEE